MKFSKLEQEQIKKLCEWAKEANRFMPIRDYYACSGLEEGTGVICIYDEKSHQPKSTLYVDAEKCKEDEFVKIREYENNCLFRFSFIYKLERLGLITISKTSYPNTDSKGWACFEGYKKAFPIDRIQCFNDYTFIEDNGKDFKIIKLDDFGNLSNRVTREIFDFSNKEISSKLDIFGLVTSVVSIEQELFELVSNDFKTYEDIQLEEARKQTESAQESLKEAQKQTRWSIGAVCLSILTLIASIVMPIILSKCSTDSIENKMEKSQFDSIQSKQNELINTLYPLKTIQITNDSLIKKLNLAKESIDEISNTLKEIKELNSKRK